MLCYPYFTRDFIVHTDASGYGVGSVLVQMQGEKGKEKEVVISYTSQHLNKIQTNCSTIEKEAYAKMHSVKVSILICRDESFKCSRIIGHYSG